MRAVSSLERDGAVLMGRPPMSVTNTFDESNTECEGRNGC